MTRDDLINHILNMMKLDIDYARHSIGNSDKPVITGLQPNVNALTKKANNKNPNVNKNSGLAA